MDYQKYDEKEHRKALEQAKEQWGTGVVIVESQQSKIKRLERELAEAHARADHWEQTAHAQWQATAQCKQELAEARANINNLARGQAKKMVDNGTGTYWKQVETERYALAIVKDTLVEALKECVMNPKGFYTKEIAQEALSLAETSSNAAVIVKQHDAAI